MIKPATFAPPRSADASYSRMHVAIEIHTRVVYVVHAFLDRHGARSSYQARALDTRKHRIKLAASVRWDGVDLDF